MTHTWTGSTQAGIHRCSTCGTRASATAIILRALPDCPSDPCPRNRLDYHEITADDGAVRCAFCDRAWSA